MNDYSLFWVISVRVEGQSLRLKGPSLIVGWTEGFGASVPCLFWFDGRGKWRRNTRLDMYEIMFRFFKKDGGWQHK